VEDPERDIFRAWPLADASGAVATAGDKLDGFLRRELLARGGVDDNDPTYRKIHGVVGLHMRMLKERLFRDGFVEYAFESGKLVRVNLGEFLELPAVRDFSRTLAMSFDEVVSRADPSFRQPLVERGMTVVLTGGGADLPMVVDLATARASVDGNSYRRTSAAAFPEFLAEWDPEVLAVYPQLAVAIGGCQPVLLDERLALDQWPGKSHQDWVLVPYPTRGQ
jgi:molecular chaperone HscA